MLISLLLAGLLSAPLGEAAGWTPGNAARLQTFLETTRPTDIRHVAIFDWDNTVIKNDVGDAVFFWMIRHGKMKAPEKWSGYNRFLSRQALTALNKQCPPGKAISAETACADLVLSIYTGGTLPGGKTPAWNGRADKDLLDPAYAWAVQMTAGYTPDEVRSMAQKAIAWNLKQEFGATQTIGTGTYSAYVRIYSPMAKLITQLQENGIEVWVVSASSQFLVEAMAPMVGVPANHVIGVRPRLGAAGRITAGFEGCAGFAHGNQEIITYRKGKRCWINKIIFGETDPRKLLEAPSPILFAAGDSDTDAFFLRDATGLRLVIDRRKPEVTRLAVKNADGKWLLQPMFIAPSP